MLRRAPPVARSRSLRVTRAHLRAQALANGIVYNAVDGCKRLGINGGHSPRSTIFTPTLSRTRLAPRATPIWPSCRRTPCQPACRRPQKSRHIVTPPLHHRCTTVIPPLASLTQALHARSTPSPCRRRDGQDVGLRQEERQPGQVRRWLLRRQGPRATQGVGHALPLPPTVAPRYGRSPRGSAVECTVTSDRHAPLQVESKLKTRRTSGDMSVFTSGENAMDAVLSQEGGKML